MKYEKRKRPGQVFQTLDEMAVLVPPGIFGPLYEITSTYKKFKFDSLEVDFYDKMRRMNLSRLTMKVCKRIREMVRQQLDKQLNQVIQDYKKGKYVKKRTTYYASL